MNADPRRMQVLFAHNEYGRHSGEEEAVATLAALLTERGHGVTHFSRSSASIGESLSMKAKAAFSGVYNATSRREFSALLRGNHVDIVQIQNLYPFISPSILPECRAQGVPVVMRCPNYRLFCPAGTHMRAGKVCELCLGAGREWHCIRHNCEGSLPKSIGYAARNGFARISRMIIDNVDRFIVLSRFQRDQFIRNGIDADRIDVLPNVAIGDLPVDTVPDGDLITFAGRLTAEKGILEFIAAARALPHLRFVAAGHAPDELACQIRSAPANFCYLGFLDTDALDALFAASRMVVCPSKWYEGFPNVIARAMSHARPVVACRIGPMPEIVEDGVTGLLCEPGDTEALSHCIASLAGDRETSVRMGRAGRAKAQREYSRSRVADRLLEIYADVIDLRNRTRPSPQPFVSADDRSPAASSRCPEATLEVDHQWECPPCNADRRP